MAFFKRRQAEPRHVDEGISFMTTEEATRLRSMVREAFATHGVEVTVFADHVRDADGTQFGLWNIAAACQNDERGDRSWRTLIEIHVAGVLECMYSDPFEGLTPADAASRVYIKLYDVHELTQVNLAEIPHAEFASGLVEILALDLPHGVRMINREQVERLGGWAKLRNAGLHNLSKEDANESPQLVGKPDGGHFHALICDSVYTASRALLMPGVATNLTGGQPGPEGWLLSVPNRHMLCWHVIRDQTVIASLNAMAWFAPRHYEASVGPLSPFVYWWDGTEYQRITQFDEGGAIEIHVSADLQTVLERLADTTP